MQGLWSACLDRLGFLRMFAFGTCADTSECSSSNSISQVQGKVARRVMLQTGLCERHENAAAVSRYVAGRRSSFCRFEQKLPLQRVRTCTWRRV